MKFLLNSGDDILVKTKSAHGESGVSNSLLVDALPVLIDEIISANVNIEYTPLEQITSGSTVPSDYFETEGLSEKLVNKLVYDTESGMVFRAYNDSDNNEIVFEYCEALGDRKMTDGYGNFMSGDLNLIQVPPQTEIVPYRESEGLESPITHSTTHRLSPNIKYAETIFGGISSLTLELSSFLLAAKNLKEFTFRGEFYCYETVPVQLPNTGYLVLRLPTGVKTDCQTNQTYYFNNGIHYSYVIEYDTADKIFVFTSDANKVAIGGGLTPFDGGSIGGGDIPTRP